MSPLPQRFALYALWLAVACGQDNGPIAPPPPPPNAPPVARFGSSCADLTCAFSDSSTDADGRIAVYHWVFGDNSPDGTTRDPAHTYGVPGEYVVVLTVADDSGATTAISRRISTGTPPPSPPNISPVALFGSSCVHRACTFSDLSSDADGTVVSHHWTFGDGQESDASRPAHKYASPGFYLVQLVVIDDQGGTATALQQLAVTASSGTPTIAMSPGTTLCYPPGYGNRMCLSGANLYISNIGSGTLLWTSATSAPWLHSSPTSGTAPSTIHVWVGPNLPPGIHSATITISATGATNSPQSSGFRVIRNR